MTVIEPTGDGRLATVYSSSVRVAAVADCKSIGLAIEVPVRQRWACQSCAGFLRFVSSGLAAKLVAVLCNASTSVSSWTFALESPAFASAARFSHTGCFLPAAARFAAGCCAPGRLTPGRLTAGRLTPGRLTAARELWFDNSHSPMMLAMSVMFVFPCGPVS